ncbi:unnamed protein product [Echinostoma caproni]|uniref:Uncharacterized protein n=1 Tax=Echinostoma caproni TaxID=27848 RepID=A0A3P8HAN4_9TREM|nr:unnamed protein product [Echinostoma caproni]
MLENLSGSVQRATDQPDPQICCVLLDSGWLKSQLGHHVAHLCSIYGVRLIVLRPVQTLAKLMSTDLHTISRCIAVGVCSSHTAPSELRDWIDLVCNSIPPLSLPLVTPPQLPLPQPLKRTVASSDSLTTTNTEVIAQPWDNYVTDPAKLYLPSDWTVPPDRIITLTALWRLFGNPKTEIRSRSDRKEAEEMEYLPLVGSDSFQIPYGDTLVRTVPGQTDAQRQNKKRDSRPSKKSKGKRKKKRRHNELQC